MKTKGFVTYRGRTYRVTPGLLRTLERTPGGSRNVYVRTLLLAEGYTAGALDRPPPEAERPMEQLPLFGERS